MNQNNNNTNTNKQLLQQQQQKQSQINNNFCQNSVQQFNQILQEFKQVDLQKTKQNLINILSETLQKYNQDIDQFDTFDFNKLKEAINLYKVVDQKQKSFFKGISKKILRRLSKEQDKTILASTILKKQKIFEKIVIKQQLKNPQTLQIQNDDTDEQTTSDSVIQPSSTQNNNNKQQLKTLKTNYQNFCQQNQQQTDNYEPKITKKLKIQDQEQLQDTEVQQNFQNNNVSQILKNQKKCHICSEKFKKVHFFYDQLCQTCAEFNYEKRFLKCNLKGKYALVTGARVKIGYQIALILLRNNCEKVIVTSRFSKDTLQRYSKEPDFDSFKDRLVIYALDFRNLNLVHQFCQYLEQQLPQLDILINNAAQTLRRDPQYYTHLLEQENLSLQDLSKDLDINYSNIEKILPQDFKYEQQLKNSTVNSYFDTITQSQNNNQFQNKNLTILPLNNNNQTLQQQNQQQQFQNNTQNLSYSVITSQMPVTQQDLQPVEDKQLLLPSQKYDINQQQIDLSNQNSWVQKIDQIDFKEFAETQIINSWAPYLLIQNLKNLMCKNNPGYQQQRVIQNVTSMEGNFNKKYKSSSHPHTNMSKASLNMLTRTCGSYYKQFNIYMNCADTGWVSEMNPNSQNIQTTVPLDEIDGAMRVLDSIFTGYNTGQFKHSLFYKNYQQSQW